MFGKFLVIMCAVVPALAGCTTGCPPAQAQTGINQITEQEAYKLLNISCLREPDLSAWGNHTPDRLRSERIHYEGGMSISIDVTPTTPDQHGETVVALEINDHVGHKEQHVFVAPPDYQKKYLWLERVVRCMQGSLEYRWMLSRKVNDRKAVLEPKPRSGPGITEPGMTGFCDKTRNSKVVRKHAKAIRSCYEKEHKANPRLAGKVTVRWTIKENGKTANFQIAGNTMPDAAVAECIAKVFDKMTFDRPQGGVCIVQWPFVFNPDDK